MSALPPTLGKYPPVPLHNADCPRGGGVELRPGDTPFPAESGASDYVRNVGGERSDRVLGHAPQYRQL